MGALWAWLVSLFHGWRRVAEERQKLLDQMAGALAEVRAQLGQAQEAMLSAQEVAGVEKWQRDLIEGERQQVREANTALLADLQVAKNDCDRLAREKLAIEEDRDRYKRDYLAEREVRMTAQKERDQARRERDNWVRTHDGLKLSHDQAQKERDKYRQQAHDEHDRLFHAVSERDKARQELAIACKQRDVARAQAVEARSTGEKAINAAAAFRQSNVNLHEEIARMRNLLDEVRSQVVDRVSSILEQGAAVEGAVPGYVAPTPVRDRL